MHAMVSCSLLPSQLFGPPNPSGRGSGVHTARWARALGTSRSESAGSMTGLSYHCWNVSFVSGFCQWNGVLLFRRRTRSEQAQVGGSGIGVAGVCLGFGLYRHVRLTAQFQRGNHRKRRNLYKFRLSGIYRVSKLMISSVMVSSFGILIHKRE